jgi:hypothetical protein
MRIDIRGHGSLVGGLVGVLKFRTNVGVMSDLTTVITLGWLVGPVGELLGILRRLGKIS